MIGKRIAHYEVLDEIGAGGMGVVYKARDTRLERHAALKALPEGLAADPERLARFEREAKLLGSLKNPHIATVYGLEEVEGRRFLAMELVEGESLAERLSKGALPVRMALELAQQIAEGLEAAHEADVIHRDVKPGNIMIDKEGKAKVLDFGLAKALTTEAPEADLGLLATLPQPMTQAGQILGTVVYMSPEQFAGQEAGKQSDIWAFGCVLYEMLAGKRAVAGPSVGDADVEPDWEALPAGTPVLVRGLIRRCLRKDPRRRLHDIADARIEIQDALDPTDGVSANATRVEPTQAHWVRMLLAGLAVASLGFALGALLRRESPDVGAARLPLTHTVIELPSTAPLDIGSEVPQIGFESTLIALSPDGSQLVYVGKSEAGRQLYLRSLDTLDVTPIPGTGDALHPFFSPDGLWVGFLTTDKVKKVSLQGGAPVPLCDFQNPTRASWGSDGYIYVASVLGSSVARVPTEGGEPSKIGLSSRDNWATWFDQVLPGGKWALITDWSRGGASSDYADILLLSLETLETKRLIEGGYDARYVTSGHLLFARSGTLFAVAFDLDQLEVLGEPAPVVSDAAMNSLFGQAQVAVSQSGTLVYVPGGDLARGKLAWVDRQGETEFLPVPERLYGVFDLAPGGERLAVHVADVNDFIWIYDFRRNEGRRLMATGQAGWPTWAPDGKNIAYFSWQGNDHRLVVTRAVEGGGQETELLSSTPWMYPNSWSPDGQAVGVTQGGRRAGLLLVEKPAEPQWFHPDGVSWSPSFSPDSRWVTYAWHGTGRAEVWARSLDDGNVMHQVSVDGGVEPSWCETCGELFYRQGNRWLATTINLGPELAWEPSHLVFKSDFIDTLGRSYDVSPDGQRLLVAKRTRQPNATRLHVIQNWFDESGRDSARAAP